MNDDKEKAGGQENASNLQPCCDGGSCCPSGSDGGGKNWKIAVFILIVVAAGAVLARSFIRSSDSATEQGQNTFAAIQPELIQNAASPKADTEKPAATSETTSEEVSGKTSLALWGPELDSLASLNKAATDTDAVFILLAANDQASSDAATKQIEAAAGTIRGGGKRISAFRLKQGTADYANLTKQLSIPCVLALVRGGGMSGVPAGQITETNLIQAFVAASRPASGCCPPGSGATCP